MENFSHSRQPNRSIPKLPKKPYTGNGFTSGKSTAYDDVFGGPPKFGAPILSPRLEDYREIFGGFHASRASSIPVLDLPVVDDEEDISFFDVRSSGFDYREVFGGFDGLDFAASYEELMMEKPKYKDGDVDVDSSEEEAWSPEGIESVSGVTDDSKKSHCLSNGDSFESVEGSTEFCISYNKGSQGSRVDVSNDITTQVTEEHAIPSYTKFSVDREKVYLEQASRYSSDGNTEELTVRDEFKRQQKYIRNNSCPTRGFVTVSDISLKTRPLDLPPPARPPPVKNRDSSSSASNSRVTGSNESIDGCSPNYFDVDIGGSPVSAAMKDAMEQAHAKLKSAKEFMERKKEGVVQTRGKTSSTPGRKDKEGKSSKSNDKEQVSSKKQAKKSLSLQNIEDINGSDEWKEAIQFFEVVRKDQSGNTFEQINDEVIASDDLEKQREYIEIEARPYKKHDRKLRLSKEICDEEIEEKHTMRLQSVESEKKRNGVGLSERHQEKERSVNETYGQIRNARMVREALEQEENRGEREGIDVAKSERRREEALDRKASERRQKEALEQVEGEMRQNEALRLKESERRRCEQEENELRQKEALEQTERKMRQKEAREKEEKEMRQKQAREKEEKEMRQKEALERAESEKRRREALDRAESERREKAALEREEHERKLREQEERERREKTALEQEEKERRKKAALEQEEKERREKAALEQEEKERREKAALELEEKERREKAALEQEAKEMREKAAREQEEKDRKEKVALEREEKERREKAALEQEAKEMREKAAREQEEKERKEKVALKREEKERREKAAIEQEAKEMREKAALELEENERMLREQEEERIEKAALEQEEREKMLREQKEKERREKAAIEQKESERRRHEQEEMERREKASLERKESEMRLHEQEEARREKVALEQKESERRRREQEEKENRLAQAFEQAENEGRLKEALESEGTHTRRGEILEREEMEKGLREAIKQKEMKQTEAGQRGETQMSLKTEHIGQRVEDVHETALPEEASNSSNEQSEEDQETVDPARKFKEASNEEESTNLAQKAYTGKETEKKLTDVAKRTGREELKVNEFVVSYKSCRMDDNKNPQDGKLGSKQEKNCNKLGKTQQASVREGNGKTSFKHENSGKTTQRTEVEYVNLGGKYGFEKTKTSQLNNNTSQTAGRKDKNFNESPVYEAKETDRIKRERELEKFRIRKIEEEREREREREKDRMAVDRLNAEARDKAERAALERLTAEARQRTLTEARERLEKACAEAREKSSADEALMDARVKFERAAVERATAEARERAVEKAAFEARQRMERSTSDNFSTAPRYADLQEKQFHRAATFSGSRFSNSSAQALYHPERYEGVEGESAQRHKARLERHQRTAERAANALAEKNTRDLIAQREQIERNRLAETLDADVKRWSGGKEGNLRALLSTLQYILGPDSGWQSVPLTEVITSAAVKKAYRKATLCVHPDKVQQRGASIQQKYICEKVFDLLKEAWNKFNSEER